MNQIIKQLNLLIKLYIIQVYLENLHHNRLEEI